MALATILSNKLSHAAPIGLAEKTAKGALAAGHTGAAAASASSAQWSLVSAVERQFSMLKLGWFAAGAISAILFLGACGVVVHTFITHDRPVQSVHESR